MSDHRPTLPPHRPGSTRSHLPPRGYSDRSAMLSGRTLPHPNGWHRALASRTGTSSRRDNKRWRMRVDCTRSHLVKDVPIYRKIPHLSRETLHQRLLLTWRSLFSWTEVIHATTIQPEPDGIALMVLGGAHGGAGMEEMGKVSLPIKMLFWVRNPVRHLRKCFEFLAMRTPRACSVQWRPVDRRPLSHFFLEKRSRSTHSRK